MAKRKDAVTMTELRKNAARVLKRARSIKRPVLVTCRTRPAAFLVEIGEFAEAEEADREAILRVIRRGRREISEGRFYTLDDIRSDLEKVLRRNGR